MVTVVGAGPSGLLCAKEIANNGMKVIVYEENYEIGKPVACTGLISKTGLKELNIDFEGAVINECRGARFFSPSGQMIEVKRKETQAYVIDRAVFDKIIAEEAEAEGAKIIKGKRFELSDRVGEDIVVGADGVNSEIARSMGINQEYVFAYQIDAKLEKDEHFVELHFGPWSKHFFAWIVPLQNNICHVGIGIRERKNPRLALESFLKARGMKLTKISELAGQIPIYKGDVATFPDANIVLVGDAASQIKNTTGGGLVIGGFCGRIAGEIIGKNLAIEEYEKGWRYEYGKELELHARIRKYLDRLNEAQLERLFMIAEEENLEALIEEHGDMERIGELVSAIMGRPSLLLKLARFGALF